MAEDDIYHSKARYKRFMQKLDVLISKPEGNSKESENLERFCVLSKKTY